MPSTFECTHCKSRYNRVLASVWCAETRTETSTYQCKQCLNLFDIARSTADEDEDEIEQLM